MKFEKRSWELCKDSDKVPTFPIKEETIGPLDTLIAAHALSLDLTIVSNNIKEFSRIPKLMCENWVSYT